VSSNDVLARLLTDSRMNLWAIVIFYFKNFDVGAEKPGSHWKTQTHTVQKLTDCKRTQPRT